MAKIPTVVLALVKKYKEDTEGYIKIKVWLPGKNKHLPKSTKYKIPTNHWDSENEIVKKSFGQEALIINREIHKEKQIIVDRFNEDLKKNVQFTEAYIKSVLNAKGQAGDFIQFFYNHLQYIQSKFTLGYYKHFLVEYNKLIAFAGENLSFSDINTSFLERYEISMKVAATTKATKMRRLSEIINKAIDQEYISKKQIAGYKWPVYNEPERMYLTLDQTERLANNIYKGEYDSDMELKTVSCYFLVECYSGIRFSDWGKFEVEKLVNQRNLKVRAKKNGEPVYLPLHIFTRLGRIVDYIMDNNINIKLTEQATNRILKHVGRELKLKFTLTTHVGRHTCGTLLGEMGYTTTQISEVLGITEQTAMTYIKRTRQGLDNAFARHGGL